MLQYHMLVYERGSRMFGGQSKLFYAVVMRILIIFVWLYQGLSKQKIGMVIS
jgi:hypothetical protein